MESGAEQDGRPSRTVVNGINSEPKHMSRFEEPCSHRAGILGQCPSSGRIQCVPGAFTVGLPVACRLEAGSTRRLCCGSTPHGLPLFSCRSAEKGAPLPVQALGGHFCRLTCPPRTLLLTEGTASVCTLVRGSASAGHLWTGPWPSLGARGFPYQREAESPEGVWRLGQS